jgi:hypothetical protein
MVRFLVIIAPCRLDCSYDTVVTERAVCCGMVADDRRASEVRVEEIMPPASACCGADESVNDNCYL